MVTRLSVVSVLPFSNSSSTPLSGFTATSRSVSETLANQSVPMTTTTTMLALLTHDVVTERTRTDVTDVVPTHHTDLRTGKRGNIK